MRFAEHLEVQFNCCVLLELPEKSGLKPILVNMLELLF